MAHSSESDTSLSSRQFLEIVAFVEYLNTRYADELRRSNDLRFSELVQKVAAEVESGEGRFSANWTDSYLLSRLEAECGWLDFDRTLLKLLLRQLKRAERSLQRKPAAAKLEGRRAIEEPLDPLLTLQEFLIEVAGENELLAAHYVQFWIRRRFDLHLSPETTVAMHDICRSCNELFFEHPNPARYRARQSRAVPLDELIRTFAEIFAKHWQVKHSSSNAKSPAELRAIGLYFSFRSSRLFRPLRVSSTDDDSGSTTSHSPWLQALRPVEYTYSRTRLFGSLFGIQGFNFVFRGGLLPRGKRGRTYMVEGSPGSGKTVLALHMMADMARRGQLAVYASLDESYETIVDRLVTFDLLDLAKYVVVEANGDVESIIRAHVPPFGRTENHDDAPVRSIGLLVLYGKHSARADDLTNMLASVARATRDYSQPDPRNGYWKWRAVAIDSLEGLDFDVAAASALPVSPSASVTTNQQPLAQIKDCRGPLRSLVDCIEEHGFWGIVLSSGATERSATLASLAETWLRLGVHSDQQTRFLEILKCRTQDYQPGRHIFRVREGSGICIYPSLDSVSSSMSRQVRVPFDSNRQIPLPSAPAVRPAGGSIAPSQIGSVMECSSVLIQGPSGSGKTRLMLHLATSPAVSRSSDSEAREGADKRTPTGVVLVNFNTSEARFEQVIHHLGFGDAWNEIPYNYLRWFLPRARRSGAQIVAWLMGVLREAKRAHRPIERLVFNEVMSAGQFFAQEPLFFSTVLAIAATQGLTTTFVVEDLGVPNPIATALQAECSYVITTGGESNLHVAKHPSVVVPGP